MACQLFASNATDLPSFLPSDAHLVLSPSALSTQCRQHNPSIATRRQVQGNIRNGGDHTATTPAFAAGLGDLIAGPRAVAGSAQDGCPYVATPAALVWRERLFVRVQDDRLGAC